MARILGQVNSGGGRVLGKANQGDFRYDVAPLKNVISLEDARQQAQTAKQKAEEASSPLGFAKNFGKAFVENIAPSEVGLGKTLGAIMGGTAQKSADNVKTLSDSQVSLQRKIKEYETQGKDATRLKQVYNQNADKLKQLVQETTQQAGALPTTGQAAGQLGGTALDLLTFGTYGKAAQGLKTGLLGTAKPSILPTAAQSFFSKATAKEVGLGGTLGYGFDVAFGLQEGETGGEALTPGLGTALGLGIPTAIKGGAPVENKLRSYLFTPKEQRQAQQLDKYISDGVNEILAPKGMQTRVSNAQALNTDLRVQLSDPQVFGGLKIVDNKINPDEAVQIIDDRLDLLLEAKRQMLPEIDRLVPEIKKQDILREATKNVTGTKGQREATIARIERELSAYPDTMPISEVDRLRADARASSRSAKGTQKEFSEFTALEDATQNIVFQVTDNLPVAEASKYAEMNTFIKDLINTKKFLDTGLRGQTVKNGRLGSYVARVIGASAGSQFGVLGTIAGSEVGGAIANILTNNKLGSSVKWSMIKNITKDPVILQEVQRLLTEIQKTTPPMLLPPAEGAFRSSVGSGRTINLPKKLDTETGVAPGVIERSQLRQSLETVPFLGQQRMLGLPPATSKSTGVPISLPREAQTSIDKREIQNLSKPNQELIPSISRQNTANTTTTINPKTDISPTIPQTVEKSKSTLNKLFPTGEEGERGFIKAGGEVDNALMQEARKYKSAEEFVEAQKTKNPDYALGDGSGHSAPLRSEETAPAFALDKIYPSDIYDDGVRLYGGGNRTLDDEVMKLLTEVRGKPDANIIVYRAIPNNISSNEINRGDWISLTKGYAKDHGETYLGGDYKIVSKKVKADEVFTDANSLQEFGYDPRPIDENVLTKIWEQANKQGGFIKAGDQAFKNYPDLTAKHLSNLEGKNSVSKQFILDTANRPELRQAERDLIRDVLSEFPDGNINVQEYADKIKTRLLPLETKGSTGRYEGVTLGDDLRGNVAKYEERVYESPIKTSAGDVHRFDTDNYFAHTRIEDMADGKTRRVIEAQSDLFQKGRLETSVQPTQAEIDAVNDALGLKRGNRFTLDNPPSRADLHDFAPQGLRGGASEQAILQAGNKGVQALQPYRNTWHERVIREEIQRAAKDGKTKLQFPTGETAMKIEGLGDEIRWADISDFRAGDEAVLASPGDVLQSSDLKVGQMLTDTVDDQFGTFDPDSAWVVTEVLGDGKFKAVSVENAFEGMSRGLQEKGYIEIPDSGGWVYQNIDAETFDISGKVDTSNPIYKFYEKDVQKFLKRIDPSAKRVTDAQGVEWIEIPITKKMAQEPVQAFGSVATSPLIVGAGIGVLGSLMGSRKRDE